MNLEGRKIVINKSTSELVELLKDAKNYEQLMPESLQKFEIQGEGFKFGLKGMPEIALKIGEISNQKAVLQSASSSLDFELTTNMKDLEGGKSEIQMVFEGKFNPFIKMMVEKPLKNFIEMLTDKIEQIFA